MTNLPPAAGASFEMRFVSLFAAGRSLVFPCNAQGQVDLDGLPDQARNNYLFARTLVGRDFAAPRVRRCKVAAEEV